MRRAARSEQLRALPGRRLSRPIRALQRLVAQSAGFVVLRLCESLYNRANRVSFQQFTVTVATLDYVIITTDDATIFGRWALKSNATMAIQHVRRRLFVLIVFEMSNHNTNDLQSWRRHRRSTLRRAATKSRHISRDSTRLIAALSLSRPRACCAVGSVVRSADLLWLGLLGSKICCLFVCLCAELHCVLVDRRRRVWRTVR
jgi:hypothetical protein